MEFRLDRPGSKKAVQYWKVEKRHENNQSPKPFILVFALLVVMLGFGMVIPVLPFLIDKLGASGSTLGILVDTAALTEFLFGSIWGATIIHAAADLFAFIALLANA